MKKLLFLPILLIIFTLLFSGCNGLVTPVSDEAKIKSVIQEYLLAINDQNWSKAKGYCIYGSDRYYAVCQMEDLVNTIYLYCDIVTINAVAVIYDVSIYGNYSEAYCYISILITACGYYESDSKYRYYYLQKIGNNWKLY